MKTITIMMENKKKKIILYNMQQNAPEVMEFSDTINTLMNPEP